MKKHLFLLLSFGAFSTFAETGSSLPPMNSPLGGGGGGANINPNTVKTLDANFFEQKADPALKESDRAKGPEANYNTEQYDAWVKECEKFKGKDMKAFRDCFKKAKERTLGGLKQGQIAIEEGQRKPQESSEEAVYEPVKPDNGDFPEKELKE